MAVHSIHSVPHTGRLGCETKRSRISRKRRERERERAEQRTVLVEYIDRYTWLVWGFWGFFGGFFGSVFLLLADREASQHTSTRRAGGNQKKKLRRYALGWN